MGFELESLGQRKLALGAVLPVEGEALDRPAEKVASTGQRRRDAARGHELRENGRRRCLRRGWLGRLVEGGGGGGGAMAGRLLVRAGGGARGLAGKSMRVHAPGCDGGSVNGAGGAGRLLVGAGGGGAGDVVAGRLLVRAGGGAGGAVAGCLLVRAGGGGGVGGLAGKSMLVHASGDDGERGSDVQARLGRQGKRHHGGQQMEELGGDGAGFNGGGVDGGGDILGTRSRAAGDEARRGGDDAGESSDSNGGLHFDGSCLFTFPFLYEEKVLNLE